MVVNHLHFQGPVSEMEKALPQGVTVLSHYAGFCTAYVTKEADNRAAVVIVWGTQTAADAAAASFGPTWFNQNIAPRLAEPQARTAGPVLAHSTPPEPSKDQEFSD